MRVKHSFFSESMLIFGMLFFFQLSLSGQPKVELKRTHAIAKNSLQSSAVPAIGTLQVLAIMVEFQPDSNELTSGTGVFEGGLPYLENNPTNIDPIPHNQSYFEAHLEFAKNYFEQSSDNQFTINYRVLPQVYRLNKKMEEYSPTGKTFTNEKLANFIVDSWNKVEENGGFDATGLDPDSTAFIIFHAGVGRDIELIGTNLDITPQDIPSITLRKNNLAELLDDPGFDGISVNNGTFRITNSLIIPRTESRRGLDVQENEFVLPLSINGLLCASIGSYLGLPDLFNTETGESGIGRFGLMDGASIFAYNGLFPPEPSAWEKIFLNWVTPFQITTETTGDINLAASGIADQNNIAQFNLSSSEYFLIENRHRNIGNDGVTLTIRKNDGSEVQQTFTNDNDTFVFQETGFDNLFEKGVLINVSEFDWSLPGGLDIGEDNTKGTDDDRLLNGGVLIWHIDEAVINQKMSFGKGVNSDDLRRGIDLEEADGSQDIGKPIEGALDNSAAFGSPFDFWWSRNNFRVITQGNTIQLYQNQFTPETFPNTNSNSGARSLVRFYDFSDNQPTASFKIEAFEELDLGYEQTLNIQVDSAQFFTATNNYHSFYPLSIGSFTSASDTFVVVPGNTNVSVIRLNDNLPQLFEIQNSSNQQPYLDGRLITGTNPVSSGNFLVTAYDWNSGTESFDQIWQVDTTANNAFLSSQNGDSLFLDFTTLAINPATGAISTKQNSSDFRTEIVNNSAAFVNGQNISFSGSSILDFLSASSNRIYAGVIKGEAENLYYIFEDNAFILADPQKTDPFTVLFNEHAAEWVAFSKELEMFRIDKINNELTGYNRNGALLANMPVLAPENVNFIGTPLLADITGDNIQEILVVGQDNFSINIFGYSKDGKPLEGFPLYVGEVTGKNIQPIHPFFLDNTLYAASHAGDVKAWRFIDFTSADWPSRYGANSYNKVSAHINAVIDDKTNSFSVLNKRETYNWPNPADEETYIRFQLKDQGQVEINIIDLSGNLVYKNSIRANGGTPEEILLNTSRWGSGAYFAMVKATVNDRSDSKLIKIAVVH